MNEEQIMADTVAPHGGLYIHLKSGGKYRLLHVARLEADPDQRMAVYQGLDGRIWVRPLIEWVQKFCIA
jgi:hypothetical protein